MLESGQTLLLLCPPLMRRLYPPLWGHLVPVGARGLAVSGPPWRLSSSLAGRFTAKIIRPNSPSPGVFFFILSPKRRYWVCSGEMAFCRDSSGRPFDFVSISPHSNQIADESCRIINISGKIGFNCGILSVYRRQRVHLRQNGHSPGLY